MTSANKGKAKAPPHAWKKGQSGNPSGRPKIVEDFRDRARKAVDERVLTAWIAEVEAQGEHWVRCSELLAAYGYGKPTQTVEIRDYTDEQIQSELRRIVRDSTGIDIEEAPADAAHH